jgi:hypothetical protein
MSAAQPHIAEIDAVIARGEWWRNVFDELSEVGTARVEALSATPGKGWARVVIDVCRLARAVRLAIVAAMRLDDILKGLAGLRNLGADALAEARARARAKAEEVAAARDKARARREARLTEMREQALKSVASERPDGEGEKPALAERDPVVEALNRRLTVDPAGVDFDDLQLRETVMRICADLNIAPDWSRWEAGEWNAIEAPPPKPVQTPPTPTIAPKVRPPPLVHGLPDLRARPTDTAIGLALQTGSVAPPGFRPKLE